MTTTNVPGGVAALARLCDLLGPPIADGITSVSAYSGVGPIASWTVGTGDSAAYLAAQIDAQVGPIDWMIHTYDGPMREIREGMSHGVSLTVVTDTDLLHADGTTTPALAEGVSA